MTQYAIVTDLNRCVSCLSCEVSCKMEHDVPLGVDWLKINRVGPVPIQEGGQFPDVEMYYLPYQCQHCADPACVDVCPTGASMKMEDGTVQVNADDCIGCESCVKACPYAVRYLNEAKNVVEKCTLCAERLEEGKLPYCVSCCTGHARFFGDLDEGIESFKSYPDEQGNETTLAGIAKEYGADQVHTLDDLGTGPNMQFILRKQTWRERG